MTTKLTTSNLSADTLAAISGPRISNVKIADSSYTVLDDTAANISGGYIIINGQNFISNCQVLIDNTPATSVTFVSNSVIRAQVPASAEGTTKSIYIINPDGSSAIIINGLTYSAFPAWSTGSTLTSFEALVPVSIQLSAPSATVYTLAAANTLPSALSLYANGLIAGTVAANTTTNYNFTVNAKDAENQDTNRNFTLPITQNVEPAWVTSANLVGVDAGINYSNTLVATDLSNVTYSVAAGSSLPSSLTLNANGLLSGNVSAANTYSFGIVATDTGNLSNTRTFTLTITAAGDTYFKYTSLLLNGETTVTPFISDASANSFALTINGDTKPVLFSPYTPGYYSNFFDTASSESSLTTANTSVNLGSGDFTVEGWFTASALADGRAGFVIGTTGTVSLYLISSGTTNWQIGTYQSPTWSLTASMTTYPAIAAWSHIAIVRLSNNIYWYINGIQVGTVANSTTYTGTGASVGYWAATGGWLGYISNFRIVVGTAVYTTTFTPPTGPLTAIANTRLLTCQSNRFVDKSTNALTLTLAGSPAISPYIPFSANSSYSTYGSGLFPTDTGADYLRLPASVTGLSFNADFTLEFWVYVTGTQVRQFFGSTTSGKCRLYVNAGYLQIYSNGSGTNISAAGAWPNDSSLLNQWVHIAISRTGSNLYFFVNGVSKTIAVDAGAVTDTLDFDNQSYIGTYSGTKGFQGYMADFRAVKGTGVYSTNFTPPASPLTAIANTSLLTLQYNGGANNSGIIDNSNFNNIVTRAGNTSQGTFSPYSVTGWSNYFDGTGDYLTPSSNTPMDFGTGNFTIEGWFLTGDKSISGGANRMIIGNSGNSYTMQLYIDSSGFLTFGNTTTTFIRGSTDLANNSWNHFAIVRSGTGSGQIKMYVNGVEVASGTNSINYVSGTIFIGAFGASDGFWNGYISNLRIIKGTALYTTTFTPSTTPLTAIANTSLLTCQSNGFIDKSTNNVTLTPTADVSAQAFSPFAPSVVYTPSLHGGSAYFDGTGDYLTTPDSSTVGKFGTAPFTVEFWMYSTDAASVIIRQNAAGTPNWAILIVSGSIYWQNGYATSSLYYIALSSLTTNPLRNAWTHIAITRNASNELKFWINGVGQSSVVTDSTDYNSTSGVVVGSGSYGAYTGYLSDVRITKGVAVYTTTFTPPTQTLGNYSTTYPASLLCNFTNGGIIDQHSGVVLETVGNAQLSTAVKKYGNASMYFDGTGDYLTCSSSATNFSTSNFTIEFWVNFASLPSSGNNYNILSATVTNGVEVLYRGTGNYIEIGRYAVGPSLQYAWTPSLNAWNHVAFVRSSTTVTIYINGTSVTSGTVSQDFQTGLTNIGSAGGTTSFFAGYIDDLRITKGIARYTSNFTAPTEALIAR